MTSNASISQAKLMPASGRGNSLAGGDERPIAAKEAGPHVMAE
jgi:hypothetical protein